MGTFKPSDEAIQLHCASPACGGDRIFDHQQEREFSTGLARQRTYLLHYVCRHCRRTNAIYCVLFMVKGARKEAEADIEAVKLGEWPPFGEKMPDRALDLVGPPGSVNRTLFLQGRKSENRGLGIGALTYYRRVVENQKAHIVGEVLRVAGILNAPADVIATLESAKTDWRFQDAVEKIKDAIPEALKIKGHNPLVLLHTPLSEGIHDLTDAQCLQRAHDIRMVLTQLAMRITNALRDESELHESVSRLLKPAGEPSKAGE